jgi:aminoglycoside phosphotransferase family enzyme
MRSRCENPRCPGLAAALCGALQGGAGADQIVEKDRRPIAHVDAVEELAFLRMECERIGARDVGPLLFRRYCLRTRDFPPPELIAFYKAIAAFVRARLAVLHLQETPVRDPEKWPKRAAEYLAIANRETQCLIL